MEGLEDLGGGSSAAAGAPLAEPHGTHRDQERRGTLRGRHGRGWPWDQGPKGANVLIVVEMVWGVWSWTELLEGFSFLSFIKCFRAILMDVCHGLQLADIEPVF